MIQVMGWVLPVLLATVREVSAGSDLAAAAAASRDGDVLRLGPGEHHGSLGRLGGTIRIEGAGLGRTEVVAPEGEDGLVVTGGDVSVAGLALRAGQGRAGVKVLGGVARIADAALVGGAAGAFVDGGRLEGTGVELSGGYGLLARAGAAILEDGSARGERDGVAILRGARAVLRRFALTGPSGEAGLALSGGEATLEAVVIRSPGPSGAAVDGGGVLEAVELDVWGTVEREGMLGDCLQVRRGTVRLTGGALVGCGGAAVEAAGGSLSLRGVDARGGEAGCVVVVEGAAAELVGNVCAGHGPGLVAASGARAAARMNRWRTDPAMWVDCGAGARIEVGRGESVRAPCRAAP
ncbi:MAG TPA: hypothetical protein VML50_11795 [Anaeromyxobacter sp.]|nr:hypothetical protein [Anaeromyxobacter sp.]